MKESRNASNMMVVVKLYYPLVISVGVFYVDTDNWTPFAQRCERSFKGSIMVSLPYWFDAISTTAEECKDPQRDLPRGMMWVIYNMYYFGILLLL
jgi:amino acid transporter